MLVALLSVPALTSGELAAHAGVTPQTASGHLQQLEAAALLRQRRQGRHRYYSLSSEAVAHFLENMLSAAGALGFDRSRVGPKDAAMRRARTCYDHMAGEIAVTLFQRMGDRAMLQWDGSLLNLTDKGIAAFEASGIVLDNGRQSRRPMCLPCLDWSERRQHLAGRAGASLLKHVLDKRWVIRSGRALQITPVGEREFPKLFANG